MEVEKKDGEIVKTQRCKLYDLYHTKKNPFRD